MICKLEPTTRNAEAQTDDARIGAMVAALRAVHPSDILGWFRHRGDPPPTSTATLKRKPLSSRLHDKACEEID